MTWKTLSLAAFMLVVSACTAAADNAPAAVADLAVVVPETPDTTVSPPAVADESPPTTEAAASTPPTTQTPTTTTKTSPPPPTASPLPTTNEPPPAPELSVSLASALDYTATVTAATLNGNALTIVNGDQVNVPAGVSGTISVTVTIDYPTWRGPDCTKRKTYCQWQQHPNPMPANPIPPGGNLGTDYLRQIVNTQGQLLSISTANGDDDTLYYVTYGFSSKGGAPPRTGQQLLTILVHRLSDI